MKIAGIVAEYNPFHTGHAYQIRQTRAQLGEETGIIAVMSGNWVQQANCAIADKWTRAKLALIGGVDLVLELPTVWATASAERFARGAVSILHATGIVDYISFGSECGNPDPLRRIARCLDTTAYQERLAVHLDKGLSFPAARQQAVQDLLGDTAALLSTPNNNLGVEYIRSLNTLGSSVSPITVLRQGAAHDTIVSGAPPFVSATQIRHNLMEGNWDEAEAYLVPDSRQVLDGDFPTLAQVERAILARLRTMAAEDWAKLPDSGAGEGLPQRLEKAGQQCTSTAEFFDLVKTKRYTHARLRRLVLWAYLGISTLDIPAAPPYLRVLGFSNRGQEMLKRMKKTATLPILTKSAHARDLEDAGRTLFGLEARYTDFYDLCFAHIPTPGREWTCGPVIQNNEKR